MGGPEKGLATVVLTAMGTVALVTMLLAHAKGAASAAGGTASAGATVARAFQGR